MGEEAKCYTMQLIEGDGTFNTKELDNFMEQSKLGECGLSYAVVAIIGKQSSGKSTLLNHLFHTNFEEMDADQGRAQITKGIWIANCVGIEPYTLVMDVEGTDGTERGEDDTAFEKQSALFVLAVSDIVLINIWCHDIGLEHAANKPLFRTVFEVMLRVIDRRKRTLMFVIRDQTRTPFEKLESYLRKDIHKIWDSVPKPEAYKQTPLSEFFNVEVFALKNYEDYEEEFKRQVASLRQKFFHSIQPGGLAGDRQEVVPASDFSSYAQNIWNVVKENRDLDLPAFRVMVATVRCKRIADEIYSSFVANKEWLEIEEAVQSNLVPDREKLNSLLSECLSKYNEGTTYYEQSTRSEERNLLEARLMPHVKSAYKLILEHIRSEALENFKKELSGALNGGKGFAVAAREGTEKWKNQFNEQCEAAVIKLANWNSGKRKKKFSCDLDSHITEVRTAKLSELTALHESSLKKLLCGPVEDLLNKVRDDTWCVIRKLLHHEIEIAVSMLSSALSGFEMNDQEKEDMTSKLKSYARGLVKEKAIEAAREVSYSMKKRFEAKFSNGHRRVWTVNEDIPAITKTAQASSLKVLSVLAAIRLDGDTDTIEDILLRTLIQLQFVSEDPLTSDSWKEVPPSYTLITPVRCQTLWDEFKSETKYLIIQANAEQKANKRKRLAASIYILAAAAAKVSAAVASAGATTGHPHVAVGGAVGAAAFQMVGAVCILVRDMLDSSEKSP